jgi:hypothetical protein
MAPGSDAYWRGICSKQIRGESSFHASRRNREQSLRECNPRHCKLARRGPSVIARKDDAPAAGQAAFNNVAAAMAFSGGGGLIQTISG